LVGATGQDGAQGRRIPPPNLGSGELAPTSGAGPLAQLELVVVRVHGRSLPRARSSSPSFSAEPAHAAVWQIRAGPARTASSPVSARGSRGRVAVPPCVGGLGDGQARRGGVEHGRGCALRQRR
jgi:hypothetical protein